jgi:hypothetical protein
MLWHRQENPQDRNPGKMRWVRLPTNPTLPETLRIWDDFRDLLRFPGAREPIAAISTQ